MSSKREAHNNLASYSKQIKSNNHVFSSQFNAPSSKTVTSPTKTLKKTATIVKKQNVAGQGATNSGQQTSHHRRSKTDGNANQLMFNQKPKMENDHMKMMRHQLEKFEMMQGPSAQSRQNNVNININSKNNKNSNQSAQSAKLKQLSQNHSKMFSNLTMEQAAKNLKLINHSNVAQQQAPTRNTNLQSQPHNDKIVKQMCNLKSESSQNKKHSEKKKHTQTSDLETIPPDKEDSIATPSGNMSIEQLKELMKNPQVAEFLKHQLELQQKGQQKIDSYRQSSRSHQVTDAAEHLPPKQSQRSNRIQQSQQFQICDVTEGSNLNSDTSQEILRYQKEWAMKFHEQVHHNNEGQQQYQQEKYRQKEINKVSGDIYIESNQGRESSSLVQLKNEESKEQISMLPESAFVNINAITSLNNNMKHPQPCEEAKINFYEAKHDTEISTGNNTEVILKEGFKFSNKEKENIQSDPNEEADDRGRHIMNGGRRLSFMTVNSNIMDNSADLLFDDFLEDSKGSKEDEDEYLTFQLCEGEEMNNEMANFIGIHMLNDGYLEGEEPQGKDDQEGGLTYQCPKTGSHFEFLDLIGRMRNLKQKRAVIDSYIQQEEMRQKKQREEKAQKEMAKQKQLQKQKKLKTQVQNILKNAQEEGDMEENLNDSMPHTADIMATDEDVILMDGSTHMNPHHVTSGTKVSQNKMMGNIYENTNDVAGPLQNQNKASSKIYNTHDGRQKQQFEGQTPDGQKTNHYTNQYDSYANQQHYPLGRTTAGPSIHQKQGAVHHQASSLASNHASKISHFSKINQPTQNQTQPSLHEHQQQQMEMNLKYQQIVQNQPPPADLSNEKNYYKQGSSHQRGKSDDLQINAVNLTSNPQNLQNMQGKTVIHTNQLSSLADTGQNTHQFNTALGSQREEFQQRSHGMTKIKSNQFNNKLQKKISGQQKGQEQKDMGSSSVFKNGGTKSSMNRNDQNLKQTAQFGPQMNLIKSQLPNQQMVQSEVRISQNKNIMSQNQLQQQKLQNQFHKSKNFDVTRQGHNSGVTDHSKPQHYMTVGPGNHNQRGMMMLQPNNALSMMQSQTQTTESNKRGYVKKQAMGTKSSDKQQSQKHVVQKQTTSNIYQTQQQRKTKLINSGGNLIVGYDVARGTSVGAMSNGSGPSIHSNQGIPNPQVMGGGSIGRNEQQIQPTQPMSVVSSIPSTVQSASKKYQTHLTSEGSKVQHTNFSSGAPNLQSYSFDYRQQHQFMNSNQQMSGNSAPQTSQINSKKVMNNINQGVVRHTKNMRSFDSQHQQNPGMSSMPQGGMMNQQKNYITSNQPGYGSKSNSANYMQNKQKSSSLNNPKESQVQNQVSQVQRSTNPGQILISKGIRLNDHGNKVHQLQTKTMADQPRDTFYKGMYKKVKSTTNQGLPHTENSLGRVNYNTAGSGNSKPSKNSQPKYQGDQNQLQVNLVHSDQYNICLNQNMNAFEEHQYQKKMQNLVSMDQEGQNFQGQNPPSSKALYKSKRITTNQRGITSGTNARVNTFDNRGIQAAQNDQRHQNSHKNENRNQLAQGPHRVSVHQTGSQSHQAVTLFQQNQGRPTSSQGVSSKNVEKQINQNTNLQGSQTKLVTQSQNQRNNGFMIQNFQQNNKSSTVHHQPHLSGGNPNHPSQSHQQQSPKKNIYLLNYQGNVSII